MTREEILAGAVNAWGSRAQVMMTIEECAELTVALSHRLRDRCDDAKVAEEIADVRIMLDQLALMIGKDLVAEAEERKLRRLEQRVREAAAERALPTDRQHASGVYEGDESE
jgi:NTP pyrophosphatase (non-canonical NTP hydrolase)